VSAPRAIQPDGWPAPRGYANGMLGEGRILCVGGMVGWDAQGRFAAGFVPQAAQALRNILAVVVTAGGTAEHIARLTWFVLDIPTYRASLPTLGAAYREVLGRHFPAMSLVQVAGLVEPEALLEIEATAILPR
jgi:enamine deaminase RidA (YjgF/YER057c/UK114 family)